MLRYLLAALALTPLSALADDPPQPSVFRAPQLQANYTLLQREIHNLIQKKDYAAAAERCEAAVKLAPQYPTAYYNLGCVLALQGKKDEAFAELEKAVERGFNNAKHLKEDADLESLRQDERFAKLVTKAEKTKPLILWPTKIELGTAKDGAVEVTEKNTVWDLANGVFRVGFKLDPPDKDTPIVKGNGEVADLLRQWHKDGTAAGNAGDLYDNHDGDHSNMDYASFPQLTRIEFAKEARDVRLNMGLQKWFFFNGVTMGNSSTAMTGGPFWRSQPRLAYAEPRTPLILYNQYVNNHIYFYPEHRDHDPGRNGQGDGYGDVYPANTPYIIVSQGSSGSDRPFMHAIASTLAAFQPEVKKGLVKDGLLMPTVQMLFRASNKVVQKPEDCLTGKAHPPVFDAKELDVVKMVKAAHDLKREDVPPLVRLKVTKEDEPVLGRDHFDPDNRGNKIFDTPSAVARVLRSSAWSHKMTISVEDVKNPNGKPLTWHWVVLRGDAKAITIKATTKEKTVVELEVPWFERYPVEPGSKMETNRVDIGVFAHNGKHYSAPAFVTFYSLDNQKRVYDEKKRIQSIDYSDKELGKNYVDPFVDVKKDWKDEYHHDKEGRLTGWTRKRGDKAEEFTAEGALVTDKDDKGRALKARVVRYAIKQQTDRSLKVEPQPGDEVLHYEYTGPDDRVGKVKMRTKVADL